MAWREFMLAAIGDASPEEKARLARIGFRIIVAVHIAWACGLLAPMGLVGFVVADEVDTKVQAAVEPIRAQLGQITTQLSKQEAIQQRILMSQLAAQLRDLNRLRCSTSDQTMRTRMERDIEDAEQEYKALSGERYPLPACKDL